MTINLYALTNDKARLCVKTAQFRNDKRMADIVLGAWEQEGFVVNKVIED